MTKGGENEEEANVRHAGRAGERMGGYKFVEREEAERALMSRVSSERDKD